MKNNEINEFKETRPTNLLMVSRTFFTTICAIVVVISISAKWSRGTRIDSCAVLAAPAFFWKRLFKYNQNIASLNKHFPIGK